MVVGTMSAHRPSEMAAFSRRLRGRRPRAAARMEAKHSRRGSMTCGARSSGRHRTASSPNAHAALLHAAMVSCAMAPGASWAVTAAASSVRRGSRCGAQARARSPVVAKADCRTSAGMEPWDAARSRSTMGEVLTRDSMLGPKPSARAAT